MTKEPTRRVTEGPRSVTRVRPRGTRGATTGAYDHRTRRTVTKGTGSNWHAIPRVKRRQEREPDGRAVTVTGVGSGGPVHDAKGE